MSMPDPKLGRVDTQATSNAIQSLGIIQNAISQGVANQLNIIQGYAQRKQDRLAQDKDIQARKDITNLNNQAISKRQKDDQNFQLNKDILKLIQVTGDRDIAQKRKVKNGYTTLFNMGGNSVMLINPKNKTMQTIQVPMARD